MAVFGLMWQSKMVTIALLSQNRQAAVSMGRGQVFPWARRSPGLVGPAPHARLRLGGQHPICPRKTNSSRVRLRIRKTCGRHILSPLRIRLRFQQHSPSHSACSLWHLGPASRRARTQRVAERREKVWKWGAQGHGVHFAERDAESAGARNSVPDRAKWGCGVGYGVFLELV
jgi:hypothetical protein